MMSITQKSKSTEVKCQKKPMPIMPDVGVKRRNTGGRLSAAEKDSAYVFLQQFFSTIPKCPSHYTRKRSRKEYFESFINSVAKLLETHEDFCKDHG